MTAEALDKSWVVYMIHASDGSYYTGVTTDVPRRFKEHAEGIKGARYFRGRKPQAIVYQEPGHSRSSACQREAAIKKLKREHKQLLVDAYRS